MTNIKNRFINKNVSRETLCDKECNKQKNTEEEF